MRARYYNPDIKRFINLDVLLGSIDEGQSLNRYAYVNGNPVLYTDPFGLCAEDICPLTAGFLWEISNSGLFGIPSIFSDYSDINNQWFQAGRMAGAGFVTLQGILELFGGGTLIAAGGPAL